MTLSHPAIVAQFARGGRGFVRAKCEVCSGEYEQQRRVFARSCWKGRCASCRSLYAGLPAKRLSCEDCGTAIWPGSVRCKSCAQRKARLSCEGCGAQLSRQAKRLCLPCHNKRQDRGLSRERTKFNASSAWTTARTACFERDKYTCQDCGVRGGVELNAHHIRSYRERPELRLHVANLITLCRPCHRAIHFKTGASREAA